MNVSVISGRVSAKPIESRLATGQYAATFDVVTKCNQGKLVVPVNWVTAVRPMVAEADEVVVVGRIRRRFFQSPGGLQSRTELLADAVVAQRRKAAVRKIVDSAARELRAQ